MVEKAQSGNLDLGAPVMGLESTDPNEPEESKVLAGDPIPDAPCELSKTCKVEVAAPSGASFTFATIWVALIALSMTFM